MGATLTAQIGQKTSWSEVYGRKYGIKGAISDQTAYPQGMILRFSLENYRSYREQVELSLARRSFRTNRPRDGDWAAVTVRRAALFGSNASGKSNVIRPLGLLATAVGRSIESPSALRELRDPHKLATTGDTRFEVDYIARDVRYEWYLELSDDGVVEESLRANPSGHWRTVFSRTGNDVTFGAKSGIPKASRENIQQFARSWALTLSSLTIVKNAGAAGAAADWWRANIAVMLPQGEDAGRPSERHRSAAWTTVTKAVLSAADVGVSAVDVNEREAPDEYRKMISAVRKALEPEGETEGAERSSLDNEDVPMVFPYLEFTHTGDEEEFTLEGPEESLGTRQWLDLATTALEVLVVGGVLLVDEIDSSLHPVLLRQLVEIFADEGVNATGAQLIFTTHDSSLLSNLPDPILGKDEVWMVSKNGASSDLVCLDEYSIRDAHNIEKRYLSGAFEAIPVPKSTDIRSAVTKLRAVLQAQEGNSE